MVHTAPGHGGEDFQTGRRSSASAILKPVDAERPLHGRRPAPFAGLRSESGRTRRVDRRAAGAGRAAARRRRVQHSYPHCWRCHSPLIFRATEQWFMNIDHRRAFRREVARRRSHDGDAGIPAESVNRITSMVANRPDWCLSRQRAWGVGIPAFYCDACRRARCTPREHAPPCAELVAGAGRGRLVREAGARDPAGRLRLPALRRDRRVPQGDRHPRRLVRLRLDLPRRAGASGPSCATRPMSTWRARTSTAAGSTRR